MGKEQKKEIETLKRQLESLKRSAKAWKENALLQEVKAETACRIISTIIATQGGRIEVPEKMETKKFKAKKENEKWIMELEE